MAALSYQPAFLLFLVSFPWIVAEDTSVPALGGDVISRLDLPRAEPQTGSRGGKRNQLGQSGQGGQATHGKCEPITIPLCANIEYNQTIMPNLLGHSKQEQAGMEVHQFFPLVKVQCSKHLQIFLCSVYAPVCTILEDPLPPCRSLCLAAQDGCEELMNKFGFQWPQNLACNNFPNPSPDQLCVGEGREGVTKIRDRLPSATRPPYRAPPPNLPGAGMQFVCPAQLEVDRALEYKIYIGDQVVEDCGAPCSKMFFTPEQTLFSRYWVGCWASLCLASCAFTMLSFLVDVSRFPYPERPIIYLTLCYAFVALGFVVGFALGDGVACNDAPQQMTNNLLMERTIRQGSMQDWRCTLLFMVLYFFFMSASIWWVVLTICWFLSASLKWGQEAIDVQSQWFHFVAWGQPAISTIVVLIMKKAEGDILTGVCFVGLWDMWSLRLFVLAPLLSYLVIGTIFLILGLFSLIKIRTVMKQDGSKTDKLEKLILRIGVFSVLYIVPVTVIIACLFYEQHYFSSWMLQWQDRLCRDPQFSSQWQIPCPGAAALDKDIPAPDFTVYMIKYLMVLIIGIFSGFWVWTEKTMQTWASFFRKLFRLNRNEAQV